MKAPLIVQVSDVLRRARKLPVGLARNDLRQLARGLLRLHRSGVRANVELVQDGRFMHGGHQKPASSFREHP